jgi:hypothetical protein
MGQAAEWTGLSAKEVGQSIRGLQQRGWAAKAGADLMVTDGGRAAAEVPEPDETVLVALVAAESGRLIEDELVSRGCETARAHELFGVRSALVEIRDKVHRSVALLAAGEQLRAIGVTARPLVTELTPRTALRIGTSKLPALSNAICPIPRWKKMSLPGTSAQVWPPFVVLPNSMLFVYWLTLPISTFPFTSIRNEL